MRRLSFCHNDMTDQELQFKMNEAWESSTKLRTTVSRHMRDMSPAMFRKFSAITKKMGPSQFNSVVQQMTSVQSTKRATLARVKLAPLDANESKKTKQPLLALLL